MPGAMRKLGLYLGLVEDDEHDRYLEEDAYDEPAPVRRVAPEDPRAVSRRSFDDAGRTRGAVALDTVQRSRRTRRGTASRPCTRAPTTRRARSVSTSGPARQ